ncbi:MAG TPA: hypothetical protein VFZ21_30945 [Gemmatimonadaceae bacterium]|nr:hypothetical protein [Gemmatimonadaceae bacterium]
MTGRLTIPKESTFDPNNRELNEKLMRFQEGIRNAHQGAQLAATRRLAPQVAVTESGFLARPGMFLPVSAATTILLAKPTPDTAGQPLAIYNSSGGVVVLDPVDSTINGRDVGWIDEGLHVLYPDASGWFGGFSRPVEFDAASALAGVTTGVLSVTPPTPPAGTDLPMLVFFYAIQGTSVVLPVDQGSVGMSRRGSNSATTVRGDVYTLPAALAATASVSVPDHTTDLLGVALWVIGAAQDYLPAAAASTDSATTTVTSGDITTTRPGALILDFMANDDETDTGTPGAGQTEIVDGSAGSATVSLQASYKSMPRPGTTTMSWSGLTNAANKAHIAIVIEPARSA